MKIKKFLLLLLLCCMIISCGKKGDPEYKDNRQKAEIKIFMNKNL